MLISVVCNSMYAQKKYEEEYSIQRKEVPKNALNFIDALDFSRKIKWYREVNLHRTSIEAKTKHDGKRYSVEFNLDGEIEDVEITIKWEEIPSSTRLAICNYLSREHDKIKLDKVQKQYSGSEDVLLKTFTNKPAETLPTVKYELVLRTKTGQKIEMMHYLFSQNGHMEERAVLIFRNSDNLEY